MAFAEEKRMIQDNVQKAEVIQQLGSREIRGNIWTDKGKRWLTQAPAYVILTAWSLFTVFAILWVIMTSLKTNRELFLNVWSLPKALHFENYVTAWSEVKMGSYFLNSVLV